jgi:glycine cleavage system H protein
VGISDHAQEELSDLVFVELPRVGAKLNKGDVFGVVESVKAASDLYMPVSGTITATNTTLEKTPETINKDAFGEGWLIKLKPDTPADLDSLMDAQAYEQFLKEEG